MPTPRVLVIAGSDSSGGAGLEADQKTLAAHSCYAMTATTALTAQNTLGVNDIHIIPPNFVAKQIKTCLDDISCDAVKIGMLASAETIRAVAEALKEYKIKNLVVDPVMIATSGAQLLPNDAVQDMRERLLPMTTILTPNIPEAILLLKDAEIEHSAPVDLDDLRDLAKRVYSLGPQAVLLKGGHMPLTNTYVRADDDAEKAFTVDILYDGHDFTTIQSPYLRSNSTHGTGCSLASAVAANLAASQYLPIAIRNAVRYVSAGIQNADSTIGHGSGPINHFHSLTKLPFLPGHFIEYLLSHSAVAPVWHAYTHHPFAKAMADGTLPQPLFKNYLVQDYLYLTHFARTNALAAYKSTNITTISASAQIVLHIEREMALHLDYCREFGLSKSDIEAQKESLACVAYSRYVLDIGMSQDWLALQMALAPCLIGYGVTAKRLFDNKDGKSVKGSDGNQYWKWIENYVAEDYCEAVRKGCDLIEGNMTKQSPSRIEELIQIFIRATEMEVRFWDFDAHLDKDDKKFRRSSLIMTSPIGEKQEKQDMDGVKDKQVQFGNGV